MTAFFDETAELKPIGRKLSWLLLVLYFIAICYMCFCSQHTIKGVQTPNIQYFGRLVILPVPFNSLFSLGHLSNLLKLIWVFGQNVVNIFLLFPLVLQVLLLFPNLRNKKKILLFSFCLSLSIECTQLLLDFFFDVNRVFEIDDLWTNSLGGLLAFYCHLFIQKKIRAYYQQKSQSGEA
ncbi:VanZ family protein [Streptococcus mutans]|uniref:VanZ family protein n=1 Tax=Streptococcus mutans TaxID=1309 RepID=UPI0002D7D4A8|nr:VanZ family protein [Streptococcus mutans]